jgi:hypothetical protein
LRLIGCAGVRRLCWPLLSDERSFRAVEVSERFADGQATKEELKAARDAACHPALGPLSDARDPTWKRRFAAGAARIATLEMAQSAALAADFAARAVHGANDPSKIDYRPTCDAVREVIGNPHRVVALHKRVLTSDVRGLAGSIYDERAFERMGILADALEDAGCDDPRLIEHCRSPGPHVRGCWVLDLILGKH